MEQLIVPRYIQISDRLFNDLQLMIEYSLKTDSEAGGMLIKAKHGRFGVASEQLGKDREIMLKPNEKLYEGELSYGSVHSHPQTDRGSTGDVTSYLADKNEKIMLVTGADKSINMYFKTAKTAHGDYTEAISEYTQEDMPEIAYVFNFIEYKGDTVLELQTTELKDYELMPADETWSAEELAKHLGLKGSSQYPNYGIKKYPKKDKSAVMDYSPKGKRSARNPEWMPDQVYDTINWGRHGI